MTIHFETEQETLNIPVHQCYGRRDRREAVCPKHGIFIYFNYIKKCPKCEIASGKCPYCGKNLFDIFRLEGI